MVGQQIVNSDRSEVDLCWTDLHQDTVLTPTGFSRFINLWGAAHTQSHTHPAALQYKSGAYRKTIVSQQLCSDFPWAGRGPR